MTKKEKTNGRYILRSPAVPEDREGVAPGQAQEMPNERAAIRQAETMSRIRPTPVRSRLSGAVTRTWEISTTRQF